MQNVDPDARTTKVLLSEIVSKGKAQSTIAGTIDQYRRGGRMKKVECCENCRFSVEYDGRLRCHHEAPTYSDIDESGHEEFHRGPLVERDRWCGKFMPENDIRCYSCKAFFWDQYEYCPGCGTKRDTTKEERIAQAAAELLVSNVMRDKIDSLVELYYPNSADNDEIKYVIHNILTSL
jgi:hypothetical protein